MSLPPRADARAGVPLSERLQTLTEALAAAQTQPDILSLVLAPAVEALGAIAGAVLLVDGAGTSLTLAATQGHQAGARTLWQDGPLNGGVPAGDALQRRGALFFEHPGALVSAYPELEARTGAVAAVATAVLPMFLDEQPLGAIILDFREPHTFTLEEQRFLRTLAAQCAIALGRTQLTRQLEERVEERTRQLEEQRAALDAFVAYKAAVGSESDVLALARQATRVIQANLAHVSVVYYEFIGGRWQARVWSQDVDTAVVAQMEAGIPADAPNFAEAARSGEPRFIDAWNAAANSLSSAADYGAAAFLPLGSGGVTRGLLAVGTREARHWSPREQALVQAVARGLALTLERTEHLRQLDEERAALDAFARFTEASTDITEPLTLAAEARDVLGATLGVQVGYCELEGGLWKGRIFSDSTPPEVVAQAQAGFPADLPAFARPFETGEPTFVDGWNSGQEGATGRPGAPALSPSGAAALYPYLEAGAPRGLLTMATPDARAWTPRERSVFRAVGRSLGLAFERSEQARALRARRDEEQRRAQALGAFAELSRDLSLDADPYTLIRRTQEVVLSLLPEGFSLYFEVYEGRWHLRSQVGQANTPELQAALDAGLPFETTENLRQPWESGEALFQDEYDPAGDQLCGSDEYPGATATLPVKVGGEVRGVLGFALYRLRSWSGEDRAVLETVGRQLTLALERAEQTRRLADQNAELEARTRALEGFADLTQDLAVQDDPQAFVRRAQEVVLSLLAPGYALYYEPDGARWVNRVQVGEVRHADLQAFIDAGPPIGQTPSLDVPWRTRRPYYQDEYARGSDTPAAMVQHVNTVASLPVFRRGEVVGVFVTVLFDHRPWTPTDRVVLDTVVGSLGLALERAEQAGHLRQRTRELERSNAELEQFAYVASHDLQAPIRAVTSFAGVLERRYGGQLDGRGRQYLQQIMASGEHMKRLVDDLLAFSRVHTEQRPLRPTDAAALFDTVAGRLLPEFQAAGATLTRGSLPQVLADPQQLDQLLQNLLGNALKYRRAGVKSAVEVSAERQGAWWRFAVTDNGIGIEPQYFERIFVIFQRLHTRETYEGTGIGLAVCKKIVERHGGRLWLESEVGQGTTFFFTLPALQH